MRRLCLLATFLGCLWFAAPVEAKKVRAFPPDADSVCGVPGGLTALQRLPPVRIVVFDPISNSFAFVACPPSQKEERKTISNQDFLDRHRLALTTQKIRLLILPYNPFDGDLFLEAVDGEGVEFEDVVGGLPPPARDTMESDQAAEQDPATMEAPELPEPPSDAGLRPLAKATVDQGKEYPALVEEVTAGLRLLRTKERCIRASLAAAPLSFTRRLASESKVTFSLERDVTLEEVEKEALRRRGLITDQGFYTPCDRNAADFRADIMAFDAFAAQQALAIERLQRYTREMAQSVRKLPLWPSDGDRSRVQAWRSYLDDVEEFMDQVADLDLELAAELDEILQSADQLRVEHDRFQSALNSPAMQIQRFNFNPLKDGKSLTFTIRRGAEQPEDGPIVPARINRLEIRSTPVHAARFAMGLVASRLRNPSYEAVAFPNDSGPGTSEESPEPEPEPSAVLLFDEEGNGKILPGMFLHHYWGRRSPLLEPTAFERWMPTLSLGIPVSEADLFTQFFLGLDWELVPGFEINAGYHFGKVNALEDGFHVGDVLPPGVAASAVQKEKFDSAVYFGIAVNQEVFDRIFRNGGN